MENSGAMLLVGIGEVKNKKIHKLNEKHLLILWGLSVLI